MAKKKSKSKTDKKAKNALGNLFAAIAKQEERMKTNQRMDTLPELKEDVRVLQGLLKPVIDSQESKSEEVNNNSATSTLEEREAFREWIRKGAPNSRIGELWDVTWDTEFGSGVVAKKDLKEGEMFLSIPRKLILSEDTVYSSPVGAVLKADRLCQSMPSLSLSVFLALERRNPTSEWKPYIDVLPRSFLLPMLFTEEDLSFLEGSPTLGAALKLKKNLTRQYCHLERVLSQQASNLNLPPFTYKDFLWAVSVVMTRQNRIPSQKAKGGAMCLIPGWDMCNYADGKLTTYYNVESDSSESSVMHDVKEGGQIFIYYGNRPNSELFVYQAFVYDEHKTDSMQLPASLEDNDPLMKLKQLMLMKRALKPIDQFLVSLNGDLPRKLVEFARMAVITKDEAAFAMKNPDEESLGKENDERAYRFILESVIDGALKKYPTSIEEDNALLSSTLSDTQNICVRMRLSEKLILSSVRSKVEALLAQL